MGLETVSYIDDLVITNPASTDYVAQGDDHIRNIKVALKASFPEVDGAVNVSVAEFNYLAGVTSAIQTQLDAKQDLDAQLTDIAGLTPTDGNIIVGDGANFVAESGATARTSLGVGTGDSPQFTRVKVNHASDTQLSRAAAGQLAVYDGSNTRAAIQHNSTSFTSGEVFFSTSAPTTEGDNGDIYFEYTA